MKSEHPPLKTAWRNLPNALSLLRISVSPILIVILLFDTSRILSIAAALLFLVACLTDWLDGYLARRMRSVTVLGKFLDPLADKLLIMTVLIMLVGLDRVPAWVVAIIVGRELAITGLRAVAIEQNVVIAASIAGKAKTVSQVTALVPLLLHYPILGIDLHAIGTYLLYLALALTIYSGAEYFARFFRGNPKVS